MPRSLVPITLIALHMFSSAKADAPKTPQHDISQAVATGLGLAEKAAANYPTHRDCFSCHHQTLPMLAMTRAAAAGLSSSTSLLQDQADFTLESFKAKRTDMIAGKGVGGGAMTVGYGLWALDLAGRKGDETTDAMVAFLLKTQRKDGHWSTGGRPPLEESALTATVIAARALERFASNAQRPEAKTAVEKARAWIANAPTEVQEDRASKLWGLMSLGASQQEITRAVSAILEKQHEDGGWPSADNLASDAYATGQTLARLLAAGASREHEAIQRGASYLLKSRLSDGSWKVETRSKPVQVYFDNGDPHGKHQFISTPATCWAVVALASLLTPSVKAEPPAADLLIRGGTIVDGTGNPWFQGDVAIKGDRIVGIGQLPGNITAARVIDAKGLVVAPGFIDMHSHSDMPLLEDGAALSKITQGVTTDILGEDTSGGPSKGKRSPKTFEQNGKTLSWSTLGGYFDTVEKSGTAINIASYVGLGTLLECVTGDALDRPTPAQLDEVKTLLDEAMTDGAFGLSTMLAGPRELNMKLDDLVSLGEVVRKHHGIYSSHIRNEGTEVFAAIDEAIAIGERAGIPVDVIHLKIADQSLWGRMNEIVAKFNAARRRGVNVQANVYPYTRGNNDLVTILPPWAHEGGKIQLLDRLKDPAQRARIKTEIRKGLPGWYNHYTAVGGDWSRMLISAKLSEKNAAFQGKTMDIVIAAKSKGLSPAPDSLDIFLDFLAEEQGSVGTIYAHHTEADMNLALSQPWCSIGSDGSAFAIAGPLRRGHPHPRNFGTFPRVLGVYVRDRHVLTLEDAIRKMTSENANKLGITDRGLLRAGLYADVTVFDPKTIIDKSTFLEPFQYSEGIKYVVVNGQPVLDDGRPTAARPGRAIRHGR